MGEREREREREDDAWPGHKLKSCHTHLELIEALVALRALDQVILACAARRACRVRAVLLLLAGGSSHIAGLAVCLVMVQTGGQRGN